jgi:DNA-binding MarR family transcriptional regulator
VPASRSRANGRANAPALEAARLERIYDELPGSADDPEGGALAMASTLILRSARVITARVDEVIAPLGLSVPKFEVLALLVTAPNGEMSFADLKRAMYMHPATMGHTMRLLEADGLVKRRPHDVDRRAYVAILTAKGKTVTRKGLDALHQIRFGLEGLTPATARVVSGKLADFG